MPNSNRQRGDYLERTTKAALDAHGWVTNRSAGSFGPADVWAMRAGSAPLMIACKTNGKLPPAERVQLVEAARKAGARAIMATRERRGWISLLSVDVYGVHPFGVPLKVPKRAAAAQEGSSHE